MGSDYQRHTGNWNSPSSEFALFAAMLLLAWAFATRAGAEPNFAFFSARGDRGTDRGSAIAVDAKGNIYVTGQFSDSFELSSTNIVLGSDAFLAKYDHDGQLGWAKTIGGTANDFGTVVAVDPFGDIYFCGSSPGLTTFDGTAWTNGPGALEYLAKYDSSSQLLWVRTSSVTARLGIDRAGKAWISTLSGNQIVLKEYSRGGALLTQHSITSSTPCNCFGKSFTTVDAATNIYVGGYFTGTVTFTNVSGSNIVLQNSFTYRRTAMVLKVNPSGQLLWGAQYGGCYECPVTDLYNVAVDGSENAYVAGRISDNDYYFAKYAADGSRLWEKGHGWKILDVAAAGDALVVTGRVRTQHTNTDGGTVTSDYITLVTRLDPNGEILEMKQARPYDAPQVSALALDSAGNPCITGGFSGAWVVDGNTITNAGGSDLFVARLQMAVPALANSVTDRELRLSWPRLADGSVLESTEDLAVPFTPIPIQTNETEFYAVRPLSSTSNSFFRLKRP